MKTLKESVKKEILKTIFKYISRDDCVVFLFGSFAKDKIYPGSDIDIGIVCNTPRENLIVVRIKEELKEIKTLRDIDVIDFSSVKDKNFLKMALKEVKIWHQTKRSKLFLANLKKQIKD